MKKVLLIDSSDLTRLTIRRVLEDHSLEIVELINADELFETPHAFCDVNLILLDDSSIVEMGDTLLQKIKAINMLIHIPVVMLIDHSNEVALQRAFRNGATGYIRKPFSEQSLVSHVNYILGPSDNINMLYSTIRKEVNRAERGNNSFSIVGIQIHDSLEPLKQLAVINKIKTTLREIDSVIVDRVLGIMLVLPFTRADKISTVAERIRQILIQEKYPQTAFSYVSFPQDGDNENELITAVEKRTHCTPEIR